MNNRRVQERDSDQTVSLSVLLLVCTDTVRYAVRYKRDSHMYM
jgi:hypothetical protein